MQKVRFLVNLARTSEKEEEKGRIIQIASDPISISQWVFDKAGIPEWKLASNYSDRRGI